MKEVMTSTRSTRSTTGRPRPNRDQQGQSDRQGRSDQRDQRWPAPPVVAAPMVPAALDLLRAARRDLVAASATAVPTARFAAAHLAALRTAAAVLAVRTRPAATKRLRNVWVLLPQVAPELAEWAAFFAAGAGKRAAAEAGLTRAVRPREADDLLRDAETFLALVETTLGLAHQPALPQVADYPPVHQAS
jgi:hypothetical protein